MRMIIWNNKKKIHTHNTHNRSKVTGVINIYVAESHCEVNKIQ